MNYNVFAVKICVETEESHSSNGYIFNSVNRKRTFVLTSKHSVCKTRSSCEILKQNIAACRTCKPPISLKNIKVSTPKEDFTPQSVICSNNADVAIIEVNFSFAPLSLSIINKSSENYCVWDYSGKRWLFNRPDIPVDGLTKFNLNSNVNYNLETKKEELAGWSGALIFKDFGECFYPAAILTEDGGSNDVGAELLNDNLIREFQEHLREELFLSAHQNDLSQNDFPFQEREFAWEKYSNSLCSSIEERIFEESFSLEQIFVPLNAFYTIDNPSKPQNDTLRESIEEIHVVLDLFQELKDWIQNDDKRFALRVICGGPGSGKSSFAKMFAAKITKEQKIKVLFVPMYLINPHENLIDEIGNFIKIEGILPFNPLDVESCEKQLLLILDGLDELSYQGKLATEIARDFLQKVEKMLEKFNFKDFRLKILISSREIIIQENENFLKLPGQRLNLLPYYIPSIREKRFVLDSGSNKKNEQDFKSDFRENYFDFSDLLLNDLRDTWWQRLGQLTGEGYKCLPRGLNGWEMQELTAQPLLNYFISIFYRQNKAEFLFSHLSLHDLYSRMIDAVYKRSYENRPHNSIKYLSFKDFLNILETIGLASFQNDGRSITIDVITKKCEEKGLNKCFQAFKDGAKDGVANFLLAFFFRKFSNKIPNNPTFIFTHKSFSEYLATKNILNNFKYFLLKNGDEALDCQAFTKFWKNLVDPNPFTTFMEHMMLSEIRSCPNSQLILFMNKLLEVFSDYFSEKSLTITNQDSKCSKDSLSKNSFDGIIFIFISCAQKLKMYGGLKTSALNGFWQWFSENFHKNFEKLSSNYFKFVCFLDLSYSKLDNKSFSDYSFAKIRGNFLQFDNAVLTNSSFCKCKLIQSNFERAKLPKTRFLFSNLSKSSFKFSDLKNASFCGSILSEVNFFMANLNRTFFLGSNLIKANISQCNLKDTYFALADLRHAKLTETNLQNTLNLKFAMLSEAVFVNSNLSGVDLSLTNLYAANFESCILQQTNFDQAIVSNCRFSNAILCFSSFLGAFGEKASFKQANLFKALLIESNFCKANFDDADLTYSKFSGGWLIESTFKSANLQNADFSFSNLNNSSLISANASYAIFNDVLGQYSDFSFANLKHANMQNSILSGSKFLNADLSNADFSDSALRGVIFKGARLSNTKFINSIVEFADFRGAQVSNADFSNVDFRGAILDGLDLRNSNLENARFYEQDLSIIRVTEEQIKLIKITRVD